MTKSPPVLDYLYGVPLYYRVEHRRDGDVLVVSYRDGTEGNSAITFEARPIGGKAVRDILRAADQAFLDGKGLLMSLPTKIQERIVNEWIGLDTPQGRERRKNTSGLTLGVLITADQSKLLRDRGGLRKAATIKDDERAINRMLTHFGVQPWQTVTPKHCSGWLTNQSQRAKMDCKRVMLTFERLQLEAGILTQLTWEDYTPKNIMRQRRRSKSLIQNQVEPVRLTDGQCRTIFSRIRKRIENGLVNGVDMDILLMLIVELELEDIAALKLSDFSFLGDYGDRLTVNITRSVAKAASNYVTVEIEDPYERRKIPLPAIAAECYRAIISKRTDLDWPLVPAPNNKNRRLSPEKLKEAISNALRDVYIIRTTDENEVKLPSPLEMLVPTGKCELEKAGAEKEELRALHGKHPQLVSAKHYYDRTNEAALNKIGSLQDRWVRRVSSALSQETGDETNKNRMLTAKGSYISWSAPNPGLHTQIFGELRIPPIPRDYIPPGGITLEFSASHGISGTIINNSEAENEKKND